MQQLLLLCCGVELQMQDQGDLQGVKGQLLKVGALPQADYTRRLFSMHGQVLAVGHIVEPMTAGLVVVPGKRYRAGCGNAE